MPDHVIADRTYRTRILCAADQHRLLHHLRPILPALQGMDDGLRSAGHDVEGITKALAPLLNADEDLLREVFRLCLAACERFEPASISGSVGTWQPITASPAMSVLMQLAAAVINDNFAAYFALKRPSFDPIPFDGPTYKPVEMPDGEGFLWRPVLRGMCKAEGLYDGTLRVEHLARMNDAIDVEEENQTRLNAALKKK